MVKIEARNSNLMKSLFTGQEQEVHYAAHSVKVFSGCLYLVVDQV